MVDLRKKSFLKLLDLSDFFRKKLIVAFNVE